ncbi:ribose-phosphate pyrophosphokinase [Sphingomonas sp. CFBP 13720]|uniref:ribose-phosphate pyrophosphokinase n=1 Tax=Sphingomonas sp. CFBP 13720 TaxID=2775302 RepID=UPI0020179CC6|nr:ribose-phosphate pyrophosphokinase [Sphingomonas sp. CFBP 13720]
MIDADGPGAIADVERVRGLLVDAARDARAMTYSELLLALGHRFTRPKMRALCRTLDAIDAAGEARGEPGLAVLVVRQSDSLPGQGWWIDTGVRDAYAGAWTGSEAATFVRQRQAAAFRYWQDRRGDDRTADPPPGTSPSVRSA